MDAIERLACVILAAGKGERAGGTQPKQYRTLGNRSVLSHAVAALSHALPDADILLVCPPGQDAETRMAIGDGGTDLAVVAGGQTRRDSVANALGTLARQPNPPSHVLIHDAARPFVQSDVIGRLLAALNDGHHAVMPVLPVADTLVRGHEDVSGDAVSRDGLYRVQTPQGFRFATLCAAHEQWPRDKDATDDAQMVRALGHEVRMVEGDARMDKITTAADFARIAAVNGIGPEWRTGTGFDVHRLEPGLPLWLCGIEVPHDHGLAGHSDADVAIHALVDAILGALGEGDIGQHFPPSDMRWKGAASDRFLAHAGELVAAKGGQIVHLDVTIICEAPKIGPHRDAMRARLAGILAVDPQRISVKATTTEGLGYTGRREGIAAQAIATIRLGGL